LGVAGILAFDGGLKLERNCELSSSHLYEFAKSSETLLQSESENAAGAG
jgi:hypothetical protein